MNATDILAYAPAARSAWQRGVHEYARELLEDLIERGSNMKARGSELRQQLLNGARDWAQYSYGGCALVYDGDIAERLCAPSELKKLRRKDGTIRDPARETWLEVQGRALQQAEWVIKGALRKMDNAE